ncbi:unnamed protein product [Aspergillus oryzae var. brunneus]|uniref:Unnamed protein product n=2 Tax=Aspergillus oryzae TaxID=5062 RepID=A0AAN5BTZ4_ASPOZ|nr:unnamed protein product [Aspergillus oryzae]GMG32619.1 unnamed protein product [Aspergillus oryzae]GMG50016.1 unnamed protein product [Aspergillus oryzae var. brunneus]
MELHSKRYGNYPIVWRMNVSTISHRLFALLHDDRELLLAKQALYIIQTMNLTAPPMPQTSNPELFIKSVAVRQIVQM